MFRRLLLACTLFHCLCYLALAQLPDYIKVYEQDSDGEKLTIQNRTSIVDIGGKIIIEFDLNAMKTNNIVVSPSVFIERRADSIYLPKNALCNASIFPDPNDLSRTGLDISGDDNTYHSIEMNLTARNVILKKYLREGDILLLVFKERGAVKEHSIEIELVDLGWSAVLPEFSAPLMAFKSAEDDSHWELGLGVTSIWRYKTRWGLHNWAGIGITITPSKIDFSDLKNAQPAIMLTISLGLSRKNPDILLLGGGPQLNKKPLYFIGLNLSWLARKIQGS